MVISDRCRAYLAIGTITKISTPVFLAIIVHFLFLTNYSFVIFVKFSSAE